MLNTAKQQPPIRRLALQVLCQVESSAAFADQLITAVATSRGLSPQGRAFLRELTYGVLRWRNRLDWLLERCSARPLASLSTRVRNLLRLGAYQLGHMQRIPAFAAVNETVRLAKQVGEHSGVVAYVNAVLRALQRQAPSTTLPPADGDLGLYLTVTQSHPAWLVERWLKCYGAAQTIAMCEANNALPPLVLRGNRRRATPAQLLASLRADGCLAEPCRYAPDGIMLASHPRLERLQAYRDGWFSVQDEAAILCGYLIDAQPGERLLDACAAPGGKATHVAELMNDAGQIICVDRNRERLQRVEANARRLGLSSLRCLVGDAESLPFGRVFDRVIVDAPCSGLGVLRRHPEAKWRKGPDVIAAMAGQQLAILTQVSHHVKPGGSLVYLTCSTEAEENQDVVRVFLEQQRHFGLESVEAALPASSRIFVRSDGSFQTWPGAEGLDGFFAVRLRCHAS